MNKLVIGLLLVTSFSAFAKECELTVHSQKTGKSFSLDFDSERNGYFLIPLERKLGLDENVNLSVKTHDHQITDLAIHTFSYDEANAGKKITNSLRLSLVNGGGAKTSNERFTLGAICSVEFKKQ